MVALAGVLAGVVAALAFSGGEGAARAAPPTPAGCEPLVYGGEGVPDVVVGLSAEPDGRQEREAVRLVLERAGWRAGDRTVGFFPCTEAGTATPNEAACAELARALAATETLVGVVGPSSDRCAGWAMPIFARASLAAVSGTNRLQCLTRWIEGCAPGETLGYLIAGRTYARVAPTDAIYGAALARYAADREWRRVYVLSSARSFADFDTGHVEVLRGGYLQALAFQTAARALGIETSVNEWYPQQRSYVRFIRQASRWQADAVLVVGRIEDDGAAVLEQLARFEGETDRPEIVATAGFAQGATARVDGVDGVLVAYGFVPPELLPPAGRELADELVGRLAGPLRPQAVYVAQAAAVLLDALARSDGTRAGVAAAVREAREADGPLGRVELGPFGDPLTHPVAFQRVEAGAFVPDEVVTPEPELVAEVAAAKPR